MTQALYAHINNKTIKIKKKKSEALLRKPSCLDMFSMSEVPLGSTSDAL
jgi:hypothetical protein